MNGTATESPKSIAPASLAAAIRPSRITSEGTPATAAPATATPTSVVPMGISGMMGLNRDNLWTPEIWARIDQAVAEEMGRVRIAQQIFPTVLVPGAMTVQDEIINLGKAPPLAMEEGMTKAFVELYGEFVVTKTQFEMEPVTGTCERLARLVAKAVAQAEDRVLFLGNKLFPQNLPDGLSELGVKVLRPKAVTEGLLFLNKEGWGVVPVDTTIPSEQQGGYPESIFGQANVGIARLHGKAQNEPIGLVLETSVFGDAHKPTKTSLVMPADRIKPLVTAGFCESEALLFEEPAAQGQPTVERRYGLLAATAGQPTTIYISQDAITIFNQIDVEGNFHFRVMERIQYVCRDPRSLVRMEFTPKDVAAADRRAR